jgi:hypothetical protein
MIVSSVRLGNGKHSTLPIRDKVVTNVTDRWQRCALLGIRSQRRESLHQAWSNSQLVMMATSSDSSSSLTGTRINIIDSGLFSPVAVRAGVRCVRWACVCLYTLFTTL